MMRKHGSRRCHRPEEHSDSAHNPRSSVVNEQKRNVDFLQAFTSGTSSMKFGLLGGSRLPRSTNRNG